MTFLRQVSILRSFSVALRPSEGAAIHSVTGGLSYCAGFLLLFVLVCLFVFEVLRVSLVYGVILLRHPPAALRDVVMPASFPLVAVCAYTCT